MLLFGVRVTLCSEKEKLNTVGCLKFYVVSSSIQKKGLNQIEALKTMHLTYKHF